MSCWFIWELDANQFIYMFSNTIQSHSRLSKIDISASTREICMHRNWSKQNLMHMIIDKCFVYFKLLGFISPYCDLFFPMIALVRFWINGSLVKAAFSPRVRSHSCREQRSLVLRDNYLVVLVTFKSGLPPQKLSGETIFPETMGG